jgi:hypothetical protein
MAIEAAYRRRHAGFDAGKVFEVVGETERALLLRCAVHLPHEERPARAQFWIPRAMATDYRYVTGKIREVEMSFPFVPAQVIWPKEADR